MGRNAVIVGVCDFRGQIRNIAYDKVNKILFDLGMLPDGTLTPNLHRWQAEPEMVPLMDGDSGGE